MANRRRSRRSGSGASPLAWFGAGLVIGLALAVFGFYRGYLPAPPAAEQSATETPVREPELLGGNSEIAGGDDQSRYDFFTVLPEMEVVVPERELSGEAGPAADEATEPAGGEQYVLQTGSFRSALDADQMKARLALLGSVAAIQTVTVNNETWHRVRIGPIQGARAADELRRRLREDGIDVLVLKVSG